MAYLIDINNFYSAIVTAEGPVAWFRTNTSRSEVNITNHKVIR